MDSPILPKLRETTEELGNALSMLRVAVDAEVDRAKAGGDSHAAQCMEEARMHLDESLASLVGAGEALRDAGSPEG